jgi:chemotaxis response regulator CheB
LADNSFTHLVVVGSSAGGMGALSGLVSSLPDDFDALAQHLDPNRESHLQEILARKSPLPVKTVTEHEPLQNGGG